MPLLRKRRHYESAFNEAALKFSTGYEAGDVNLYAYVLDNSLAFVDPFGLYTVQELAAIINNETAGLRGNLTDARIAIGNVAVNREQAGISGESPVRSFPHRLILLYSETTPQRWRPTWTRLMQRLLC